MMPRSNTRLAVRVGLEYKLLEPWFNAASCLSMCLSVVLHANWVPHRVTRTHSMILKYDWKVGSNRDTKLIKSSLLRKNRKSCGMKWTVFWGSNVAVFVHSLWRNQGGFQEAVAVSGCFGTPADLSLQTESNSSLHMGLTLRFSSSRLKYAYYFQYNWHHSSHIFGFLFLFRA